MKYELKNSTIMVRELVQAEDEKIVAGGLILPKEIIEEDQVASGTVVQSSTEDYKAGDVLLFHKVLPVNARLKLDGSDKFEEFFFVHERDVICRMINE